MRPVWRSPLRGPWLTSALGTILGLLLIVVVVTGFLSHVAYQSDLAGNRIVPADLSLSFSWPAAPAWLYAFTQGLHVNLGIAAVPFVIAKLWSVIPRLFVMPPVSSIAQAIERASIALLVASIVFQLATGIANAQYWYPFGFNFVVAHYYGAVVFTAAFVIHLVVKVPVAARAYRARGWLRPLRDDVLHTRPEPREEEATLVAAEPAAPTISRRGVLGFAGAGALLLLVANAGQSLGGPFRRVAFLAPRRQPTGSGSADFPVNKTAASAGVTREMTGPGWRLELRSGARTVRLDRAELLALPQRTARLPIACVEGWSTEQEWSGVPLAALARAAGAGPGAGAYVRSLQPGGVFAHASLNAAQVHADDALLALRVNAADLPLEHGYPARVIVPALPGVHNTKWVARIDFA
ncbi:MAG TPA: molybdopterin-dependent oxidoreductase [Solirubrobacteraceae bacterium]|nr:molybdopterin-dependent oxidoreductase [Solirubrobacteraceae bacterium]